MDEHASRMQQLRLDVDVGGQMVLRSAAASYHSAMGMVFQIWINALSGKANPDDASGIPELLARATSAWVDEQKFQMRSFSSEETVNTYERLI